MTFSDAECVREKNRLAMRKLYATDPEKYRERRRLWRLKNPERAKAESAIWRSANPEKAKRARKNWELQNPEKRKAATQRWLKSNSPRAQAHRLGCNLRTRLRGALKAGSKSGSAVRDLGCSIEYLRGYLAGQFEPGMTWKNYGKWHIDHIKPLASFDLTDRSQLLRAVHYTNLQPLWAKDNLLKRKHDAKTR